jgi:hypothetical protein
LAMSSYLIGGRRLDATPVFDTYWRFAAARQAAYEARLAGARPPWTDDPVLQSFRFTNPFRAADRVSQFLIKEVIYGDACVGCSAEDTVFRTLLFKFFNRVETWEGLARAVGPISLRLFDLDRYRVALDELAACGPIYSAAYMIPPPRLGSQRKHHNHLRLLTRMLEDGLAERVQAAGGLREINDALHAYPSIGRFLAFQFTIDINYTPLTAFDEDDFVVAGPGAVDGIRKCFGAEAAGREDAVIRYMVESQEEHFARRGLSFKGLFGRRLHLIDCQNLFCEVDKYARVAHPAIKGVSGRTRIKQRFRPVAAPLTTFFPPKWNLPATPSSDERERSRVEVYVDEPLFVVT